MSDSKDMRYWPGTLLGFFMAFELSFGDLPVDATEMAGMVTTNIRVQKRLQMNEVFTLFISSF